MISSHIFVVQKKVFRQFFRQKGGKEQALDFGFQVCCEEMTVKLEEVLAV
jgi:hypothetical protein